MAWWGHIPNFTSIGYIGLLAGLLLTRIFVLWGRNRTIWRLILIGIIIAYAICLPYLALFAESISRKLLHNFADACTLDLLPTTRFCVDKTRPRCLRPPFRINYQYKATDRRRDASGSVFCAHRHSCTTVDICEKIALDLYAFVLVILNNLSIPRGEHRSIIDVLQSDGSVYISVGDL